VSYRSCYAPVCSTRTFVPLSERNFMERKIRTGKFARGELRCTWAMARQVGVQMISGVGTAKDWDWEFSGGIDGRNVWSWTGGVNECALWRHGTRRRVRTVRLTGGIGYGAAAMPCGMSHQCDVWVGRWSTRRTRPPCRHQASTSLLLALAGCVNFNGPSKMETKKFEPLRLKQMTAC
jgi:hypothetical protein